MKILVMCLTVSSMIFGKDVTTSYLVDGMMCSMNCPGKVNESLKDVDGIKSCKVDFATKTATIIYNDEKLSSDQIQETITKATYYKLKEKKEDEKPLSFWERIFGRS